MSLPVVFAWIWVALPILTGAPARAELTSYHNANPVGWMYQLPVGETPGWSSPTWFNLEFNQANIWNMNFDMTDRRTGAVYTYKADFEQSSAILDTGFALNKYLGFSVEVPYANRNGGFLDDFIDQFHQFANTDRFLREFNGKFGNDFEIQTDGERRLGSGHGEGVGNIKTKLKLWMLQWKSPTPGICDCGLALSVQAKFPVQSRLDGLTSGKNDYSTLLHLGVPIHKYTGIWLTGAVTKLGYNETFSGWPQRTWQQMYELTMDIGLSQGWGLILQARVESPFFEQHDLSYNYTYTDPAAQAAERIASGWNALTQWRGSETAGVRYRWGKGSRLNFLMMEDWGLGDRDNIGEWNYVNDAPDVAFITQWHFVF
jgi:hypothetical protein